MIDAMKQALEALDYAADIVYSKKDDDIIGVARKSLRQAIEQAEQWNTSDMAHRPNGLAIDDDDIQEYKRPWVGLTDEEIDYIWGISPGDWEDKFAFPRAIEAKLKEKNNG